MSGDAAAAAAAYKSVSGDKILHAWRMVVARPGEWPLNRSS